uniref:Uncharacterized protein n=1 Tax=Salix viminalis TaxID=40686 RepID=A0A6N2MGW7_SALVM
MLMDQFPCQFMTNFSLKMYRESAFAMLVWVFVSVTHSISCFWCSGKENVRVRSRANPIGSMIDGAVIIGLQVEIARNKVVSVKLQQVL